MHDPPNLNFIAACSLSCLYKHTTVTLKEIENAFDELTAGHDLNLIAAWEKESVLPQKNARGEWESVYHLKAEWDKGEVDVQLFLCQETERLLHNQGP